MKIKSWKTSLFGLLTSVGLGLAQSDDPTLQKIGQVIATVAPLLLGLFARDNNVTSEDVGAKPKDPK